MVRLRWSAECDRSQNEGSAFVQRGNDYLFHFDGRMITKGLFYCIETNTCDTQYRRDTTVRIPLSYQNVWIINLSDIKHYWIKVMLRLGVAINDKTTGNNVVIFEMWLSNWQVIDKFRRTF